MAGSAAPSSRQHRLKTAALVSGLIVLVLVAAGFTVSVVQIQSAITAYVGGESIWSRAHLTAGIHLDAYAATGEEAELDAGHQWLRIPLGDMAARQAMEARELHREAARAGLLQGDNHPDDIAGMIWLFRYFGGLAPFERAIQAWRDTDPYLTELRDISLALAEERRSVSPDRMRLLALRDRLSQVNDQLSVYAHRFRSAMGEAARWATQVLSIASIVFLALLAVLAWLLANRLTFLLRSSDQKFRAIFEQTAVGILQVGADGRMLDANQAAAEILGRPVDSLRSHRLEDLIHPEDRLLSESSRRDLLTGHTASYTVEQRLQKTGGDLLWARLTVSRMQEGQQGPGYFVVMLEDISESRRMAMKLSYQATHDELTGLLNRREFEHRLAAMLGQTRAEGGQHALCFIDLDQFKVVNDTSGHGAGDELLRQVSRLAADSVRERDVLARLGGDEFGLILEDCDLDTASGIAEKLRAALEDIVFTWEGKSHSIGASIGVVPVSAQAPDISGLLRAVDIACYMAKEGGRNRVYLSAEDDQQLHRQQGEMAWLNRIQTALLENRFHLDAQLIVPSSGAKPGLRYEVLIRLTGEEGQPIPPSAFLPAAERFGIINKLDRWVVTEVLNTLARHPDHLTQLEACHINLSGRSFDQPDFTGFVVAQIEQSRVPAHKLCFEITETAAAQNLSDVQDFMQRLAGLGCTFALDDFGTGVSSFSYLSLLSVDFLKIDGSFVRHIGDRPTDRAIVRAIHEIGHTLGMQTIAEFVETEAVRANLERLGVNYLQGFGLHRPRPLTDLLQEPPDTTALRVGVIPG
ncbi:putative bifunctional diguanylate cyclase/phosphodiesterase [Marinobacter sp. JSM 1782161]|uniref:putative bifunctional diguanylate cyclase/phosphodiesterase n=1 Tax=Marinobacter sp. JSM 1782161 TaxID=2685906 RepID=UPI001401D8BE|nr:EAL domain-containing protein [Marinobacter sp. JSM 1782161]